ncbi:MAG: hypothetical protein LBM09_00205 [Candidatus Nomurabacteria bacterium]|nr:hypothetical protein [Candidatus Nomurabacteria bacterium]
MGLKNIEKTSVEILDHREELFFLKIKEKESAITDTIYQKIQSSADVSIIFDELSIERAAEVMKTTSAVERQIKKLLVCVLPEIDEVFASIIKKHQKLEQTPEPRSRIEWCNLVNKLSFGQLKFILEEDISIIAKEQLLTGDNLLLLIAESKNYDELKETIKKTVEQKTIWSIVNSILERPTKNYSNISMALNDLIEARNKAAHLAVITKWHLREAEKNKKHIMNFIGVIKSNYQKNLHSSISPIAELMFSIAKSIKPISLNNMMTRELLGPLYDTLDTLQKNSIGSLINLNKATIQNIGLRSLPGLNAAFDSIKCLSGHSEIFDQIKNSNLAKCAENANKALIDSIKNTIPHF